MENSGIRALLLIAVYCTESAGAQAGFCSLGVVDTVFCDDFSDGDASDGAPGTWVPGSQPGGIRDASSGDLVFTTNGSMSTRVEELEGLRDVSIRAQVGFTEVSGSGDFIVVFARSPSSPALDAAAYIAAVADSGIILIDYVDANRRNTNLAETKVFDDFFTHDVVLQFDLFGTQLRLTAWEAGKAMPASPQLIAEDTNLTEGGEIGVSLATNLFFPTEVRPASAAVRHFAVVPEPSSLPLLVLAQLAVCGWAYGGRRRGRILAQG